MPLSPRKLEIGKDEGFTEKNDIFNLKPFGERLALIVEQNDEPLVIAIDGEWGSGKSVFAKQWAGLLRQRNTPVIEFDAFANDYHEDAFVALANEIIAYAKAVKTGEEDGIIQSFAANAAKVGRALIPVAAKVIAKAATFGAVSQEDGRDIEQAFEAAASDAGAFVEKELYDRLNEAESTSAIMENFGAALGELATKLAQWEKPDAKAEDVKPRLVVIIDELDRCKPCFALDLLEKIKHFYNVDGVSFVLVTNLRQIEAAVRGRYGIRTDAATYLQKFITVKFRFDPHTSAEKPISIDYFDKIIKDRKQKIDEGHVKLIKFYCERAKLGLRTVERICAYIHLYPYFLQSEQYSEKYYYGGTVITGVVMREIGFDITKYSDFEQFRKDAMGHIGINSPKEGIEQYVHSYVRILSKQNTVNANDQPLYNICQALLQETNFNIAHRRIIRLLNGEAVG